MEALAKAIVEHPEWVAFLASAGALVWMARQWVKSIKKNVDLAEAFGTALANNNNRLGNIEKSLERIERRP